MSVFNYFSNLFIVSLGIVVIIFLLLINHVKHRIEDLEQKNNALYQIVNTLVKTIKCQQPSQQPVLQSIVPISKDTDDATDAEEEEEDDDVDEDILHISEFPDEHDSDDNIEQSVLEYLSTMNNQRRMSVNGISIIMRQHDDEHLEPNPSVEEICDEDDDDNASLSKEITVEDMPEFLQESSVVVEEDDNVSLSEPKEEHPQNNFVDKKTNEFNDMLIIEKKGYRKFNTTELKQIIASKKLKVSTSGLKKNDLVKILEDLNE